MKTSRKILSLVTTLAASQAAAEPATKPPVHWVGSRATAVLIDGAPYMVTPNAVPVGISYGEYGRFLGETQPLLGPDGRPGCGNIATKGTPTECYRARNAAVTARVEAAKHDKGLAETEAYLDARAKQRVAEAEQARTGTGKGKQ
jgi:hypothetical protein